MKRWGLAILLLIGAGVVIAETPRINRLALSRLENHLDSLFVNGPNPCDLLGNTRGLYLEGYGAVFTTMVALIPTPILNPFHEMTRQDMVNIHERKVRQVPVVKEKMRDMLLFMAASPALDSVRPDEQIVCGATFFYYKWEDASGLPAQIVMQGEKQKLLDVQAGRAPKSRLDSIVKVQEL